MRFSIFCFPKAVPEQDGAFIPRPARGAALDQLGVDVICSPTSFRRVRAYVDPSASPPRWVVDDARQIGFAVVQTSLHTRSGSPALALIDHISRGRLIVGLRPRHRLHIYDYQGYASTNEAQARFEEAEAIILKADERASPSRQILGSGRAMLAPAPFTKPYPP